MSKGFTIIELMIVVSVIGILIAITAGAINNPYPGSVSYGIGGLVSTRCIDGYKFAVSYEGHTQQILDGQGHGISCR